MITGKTTNLGVIGHPIAHSLSPVMQNAGITAANLDYVYSAMAVAPENLEDAIKGMKALGFRGLNVTIPHKQAVMEHLDTIHEDAQVIGAVNTISNENGHLTGYNTDVIGFINGMKQKGFEPQGKHTIVLGAGGAARAIIWGLTKERAASITIGVRNVEKAQPLAQYFSGFMDITLLHWESEDFKKRLPYAQLIVNTTPLGMAPHTDAMPPIDFTTIQKDAFVYDIIYTPAETKLLKTAREHGCQTLNGEAMLVGQGAEAFRIWTGQELDQKVMAAALRQALERK